MLADVIAERILEYRAPDGVIHLHTVRIAKPIGSDVDWRCEYEISGAIANKRFYQAGADAMQALVHALAIIADELFAMERKHGGSFTWEGSPKAGFPTRPA